MRLFTALDPTPEVQERLKELLERLRPSARLRWTKAENLHLTLKFIGEYPEADLPRLREALGGIPAPAPFEVRFSGLGYFPNPRSPRVFWVGVQAPPELAQLANAIDDSLEPLGISREKRAYSPHLTLARIEDRTPLDNLRHTIDALPSLDFGAFTPDRIFLYQSRLAPGGSIYTPIGEFPWNR